MALPVCYGGLGLPFLAHINAEEFEVSLEVSLETLYP